MLPIFLDFEFNRTAEKEVNLICGAIGFKDEAGCYCTEVIDLRNEFGRGSLRAFLLEKCETHRLVSYSVEAEARALMSLDLDPSEFRWIDLYLEYKMLLNHSDMYAYGNQLIDGKAKVTRKPQNRWEYIADESTAGESHDKASSSLAAACYKLLNVEIDTDHKDEIRSLIIDADPRRIDESIDVILKYCESDIKHLPALAAAITKAVIALYNGALSVNRYIEEAENRARYSVSTAKMVSRGYPIDEVAARAFTHNVPEILGACKEDINSQTRDKLGFDLFDEWGAMRQKPMQDYIAARYCDWPVSPKTRRPSLKEEVLSRRTSARHYYGPDPVDQLLRFARLKQSLNGFLPPRKGKKTFWEFVGSDSRVRPYYNIFGSQSSRSQPSSTSFIHLKSAWMRYLVQPVPGKMIVGLDFASEEFLIAALVSKDAEMVNTYLSGDPYLGFAKASGQAPASATRETHGAVRDINKPAVLGILYKMGPDTLAKRISDSLGKPFASEDAFDLIRLFETTYSDYSDWCKEQLSKYETQKFLRLPDGWTMWGDNDNWRSAVNFGIQGTGGVVMREAVYECENRGIDVVFTLHDALYAEFDLGDWKAVEGFAEAMILGFGKAVGYGEGIARIRPPVMIRLDGAVWGYGLPDDKKEIVCAPLGIETRVPVKVSERYIDGRSKSDFEKFKKYMDFESIF